MYLELPALLFARKTKGVIQSTLYPLTLPLAPTPLLLINALAALPLVRIRTPAPNGVQW